ncbi:MAG: small-conductance mechanosensitive channel [Limisphaerales bacterium]|jgi:small-conductance mechanosensitive channel
MRLANIIQVILLSICGLTFAQSDTIDSLKTTDSLISSTIILAAEETISQTKESVGAKAEQVGNLIDKKAEPVAGNVRESVGDTINTYTDVISIANFISAVFIIIFIYLIVKLINFFFEWAVVRFNPHRLRIRRVQPIVRILIWSAAINALIFGLFNPSEETLYALLGSSAVALGFAAQDIVKNIFGGLLVILDRPFQIGDRITIRGEYGEVEKIGLRLTTLRTLDDSLVTVPNSVFISESVSNANTGALDCMVVANLWLPAQIDVERVRQIAFEAAITSPYVNFDKPVQVLFFDHFDQNMATNIKVKAYTLDARFEKSLEADITRAAKKAFGDAGIYNIR